MSVKMVNTVHQVNVLPASHPRLPPSHSPPQWGLLTLYERDPWETLWFDPQQLIWVLHAHVF